MTELIADRRKNIATSVAALVREVPLKSDEFSAKYDIGLSLERLGAEFKAEAMADAQLILDEDPSTAEALMKDSRFVPINGKVELGRGAKARRDVVVSMWEQGGSVPDIAKDQEISRTAVYNYLHEYNNTHGLIRPIRGYRKNEVNGTGSLDPSE